MSALAPLNVALLGICVLSVQPVVAHYNSDAMLPGARSFSLRCYRIATAAFASTVARQEEHPCFACS